MTTAPSAETLRAYRRALDGAPALLDGALLVVPGSLADSMLASWRARVSPGLYFLDGTDLAWAYTRTYALISRLAADAGGVPGLSGPQPAWLTDMRIWLRDAPLPNGPTAIDRDPAVLDLDALPYLLDEARTHIELVAEHHDPTRVPYGLSLWLSAVDRATTDAEGGPRVLDLDQSLDLYRRARALLADHGPTLPSEPWALIGAWLLATPEAPAPRTQSLVDLSAESVRDHARRVAAETRAAAASAARELLREAYRLLGTARFDGAIQESSELDTWITDARTALVREHRDSDRSLLPTAHRLLTEVRTFFPSFRTERVVSWLDAWERFQTTFPDTPAATDQEPAVTDDLPLTPDERRQVAALLRRYAALSLSDQARSAVQAVIDEIDPDPVKALRTALRARIVSEAGGEDWWRADAMTDAVLAVVSEHVAALRAETCASPDDPSADGCYVADFRAQVLSLLDPAPALGTRAKEVTP